MEMLMQLLRPEYEVDGTNSGSWYRCLPEGLNREDAMDGSIWQKQIGIFDEHEGCV